MVFTSVFFVNKKMAYLSIDGLLISSPNEGYIYSCVCYTFIDGKAYIDKNILILEGDWTKSTWLP